MIKDDQECLTFASLRKRAGLTQRELSIALDVTTTTVSSWESGRHEPRLTPTQTKQLLQILECTLDELVEATAAAYGGGWQKGQIPDRKMRSRP